MKFLRSTWLLLLMVGLAAPVWAADAVDMRTQLAQGWTYLEAGSLGQSEAAFKKAFETNTGKDTAEVYYGVAAVWWERRNAMAAYMWLTDALKASRESYSWNGGPNQEWDRRLDSRRRFIENNFTVIKLRAPKRGRPLPPIIDPEPADPVLKSFADRLPTLVEEGVAAKGAVQWLMLPNGTYWIGDNLVELGGGEVDPTRAQAWDLVRDTPGKRKDYQNIVVAIAQGRSPAELLLDSRKVEREKRRRSRREQRQVAEAERLALLEEEQRRVAAEEEEQRRAYEAQVLADEARRQADAEARRQWLEEEQRRRRAEAYAEDAAREDRDGVSDRDAAETAARDAYPTGRAEAPMAGDGAASGGTDSSWNRQAADRQAEEDMRQAAEAERLAAEERRQAEAERQAAEDQRLRQAAEEERRLAQEDALRRAQQRQAEAEDRRLRAEEDRRRAEQDREAEQEQRRRLEMEEAYQAAEKERLAEEQRRAARWAEARSRMETQQDGEQGGNDESTAGPSLALPPRSDTTLAREVSADEVAEELRKRRFYLAGGFGGVSVTRLAAGADLAEVRGTAHGEFGYIVPLTRTPLGPLGLAVAISYANLPVSGCSHAQTRGSVISGHVGPRLDVHLRGRTWLDVQLGFHAGGLGTAPGLDARDACASSRLDGADMTVAYGARLSVGNQSSRVALADLGWRGGGVTMGPDLHVGVLVGPPIGTLLVGGGAYFRHDQVFAVIPEGTYRFRPEGTTGIQLAEETLQPMNAKTSMARFQFGLRGQLVF